MLIGKKVVLQYSWLRSKMSLCFDDPGRPINVITQKEEQS
jgi:hypothetical protein